MFTSTDYCRLCLSQEGTFVSVFAENENSCKYIPIFFSVEIKKDDPFSTKICKTCLFFTVEIIRKRLKYRNNDRLLKNQTINCPINTYDAKLESDKVINEDGFINNEQSKKVDVETQTELNIEVPNEIIKAEKIRKKRKGRSAFRLVNTESQTDSIEYSEIVNSTEVVNSKLNETEEEEIKTEPVKKRLLRSSTSSSKKPCNTNKEIEENVTNKDGTNEGGINEELHIELFFNDAGVLEKSDLEVCLVESKQIEAQSEIPVTEKLDIIYMHPSVLKIFQTDVNITIPTHFWSYNFNPTVVVDQKKQKPWPRKNKESKNNNKQKRKKRKLNLEDPEKAFICKIHKKETETINADVKKNKRKINTIERFGAPMFYEQEDFNALDMIISDQEEQCTSYDTYNINHDRPNLDSLHYNGIPIISSIPQNDKDTNTSNISVDKIKVETNQKNKVRGKRKKVKVNCSEDRWNNFFSNYYELPEYENDCASTDEENLMEPLLLVTEKRVYLCNICSQVFYNSFSYKRHVTTHENKPSSSTQNFDPRPTSTPVCETANEESPPPLHYFNNP